MKTVFIEVLTTAFIAAAALLILIKSIRKDASGKGCSHNCSSCPYCNNNQCKKRNKRP